METPADTVTTPPVEGNLSKVRVSLGFIHYVLHAYARLIIITLSDFKLGTGVRGYSEVREWVREYLYLGYEGFSAGVQGY